MTDQGFTPKIIALLIGFFICILVIALIPQIMLSTSSTNLYAHSETQAIGTTNYKALKTIVCDGPEAKIQSTASSTGFVSFGNSSVIQLSSINSKIKSLNTATWTFIYYANGHVAGIATILCNVTLTYSNGTTKALLGKNVAETGLLGGTNATYTVSAIITGADVDPTDFIKVDWYTNRTDSSALTVDLYLDVIANPTYISGISYNCDNFTGTTVATMVEMATIMAMIAFALAIIDSTTKEVR